MAKWSIHKDADHVYKDGDAVKVDCSPLEDDVRVVHWNDDTKKGWIEYHLSDEGLTVTPNKPITQLPANHARVIKGHAAAHAEREKIMDLWQKFRDPEYMKKMSAEYTPADLLREIRDREEKYNAPRRKG